MNTLLRFQVTKSVISANGNCDALGAGFISWLIFRNLCLETFALTITQIHTQQDFGPVLGFRATGTGVNADDGIVGIMFAGKHAGKFHPADRLFQRWQHLTNFRKSLFVFTLLAEFDHNLDILQAIGSRLPIFNELLQ